MHPLLLRNDLDGRALAFPVPVLSSGFWKSEFWIKVNKKISHLIAGELRDNWNRRTLAFPLLPGLQGKLVLLKLVAPAASDID